MDVVTRPEHVLAHLESLFPGFVAWRGDGWCDGRPTHHQIMMEFLPYFSAHHATFSAEQIKAFGDWVNDAVSVDGVLENAVATCFLEHMHQVRVNRVLWPHLSQPAKDKSRA